MRRRRALIGVALALVLPVVWLWWGSLMPGSYSVMEMGYADFGAGPGPPGQADHGGAGGSTHAVHLASRPDGSGPVSLASLTGPRQGVPDVAMTLVARAGTVRPAGGRTVQGYTFNGTSPGPTINANVGDLVEVRLVNESVPDGITLHWHGYDVPNAEDGARARRGRRTTRGPQIECSSTRSVGAPGSWMAGRACGGRSTATCSPTCRCSSSTRATWCA